MTVNIHGREYKTVAERVNEIHADTNGAVSIVTEIIQFDANMAAIKATITREGNTFTGHAFEIATEKGINSTSHLENAETSAIGRALAAAGYAGSEYASADEVAHAVQRQESHAASTGTGNQPGGTDFRDPTPEEFSRTFEMPFGKYKGVEMQDVPPDYLEWARDNANKPWLREYAIRELTIRQGDPAEALPF